MSPAQRMLLVQLFVEPAHEMRAPAARVGSPVANWHRVVEVLLRNRLVVREGARCRLTHKGLLAALELCEPAPCRHDAARGAAEGYGTWCKRCGAALSQEV